MANSPRNNGDEEEAWRRPTFWTHPAYYHGRPGGDDEFRQEPLLPPAANHHHEGTPTSGQGNNRVRRSMIPWSPGQRLSNLSSSQQYSPVEYHGYQDGNTMGDGQNDEEGRRGCCCTGWFLCWICCCCRRCCWRSPQGGNPMEDVHLQRSFSQESRSSTRRRNGGYCMKILYLLISAATVGGLYYYTSRSSHQCWTMNPGESRHVATAGFLTDSVKVVSKSPSSKHHHHYDSNETISLGMAVYAMGHPDCPPLTGPPLTLDAPPQELVLLHNAFEYQYFYLNKGSTMQVTVHQTKGATNILVLRGNKVLARMQDKKRKPLYNQNGQDVISDSELAFSREQVVMERVCWTHGHAPIEFEFTSPANDVYVLLYDNAASNEPAAFNVSYHIVLTTYNLEGLAPWCSHSAPVDPSSVSEESLFACPPLKAVDAGCIIVEAIEKHGDSHNTTIDRTFLVGDGGVEVTLETTRQWMYIGAISLIPSILLALTCWYRRRKRRIRTQRQRDQTYHEPQRRRHHEQRQAEREGPNYHYLSLQDGSEGTEQENVEDEGPRNLGNSFRSSSGHAPNSREGATETSMIDIPAENVVVVKERDQLQQL